MPRPRSGLASQWTCETPGEALQRIPDLWRELLSIKARGLRNDERIEHDLLPPQEGFLFLDAARFKASFAADVDGATAAFMASSQVPWGVEALAGTITQPAWKTKPSWYLVATDDRMIPPPGQQKMAKRAGLTVTELAASHAVHVSQPKSVAAFIDKAADDVAVRVK